MRGATAGSGGFLIRYHDFDIFGAQEVFHSQLLDLLAALPGYDYTGVGRDDGAEAGEYAAVFYKKDRFQLLDSGHFWLSEEPSRPSKGWDAKYVRICCWGRFLDRESGERFWFFTLHTDHKGRRAQVESCRLVVDRIRTMCRGERAVLTGDFNVGQTSESYAVLRDSKLLFDACDLAELRYAETGTENGFDPDRKTFRCIDYLFVTEGFRVLRYGIPEFRLPKTVLDDFEYRHLRLKGIKVRPNTDVGKALKIEDLFRDGYKAIFIGTGVWRPNTLHIKGESLGNVHYAINYLQNPDVYHLGSRVIVIGAGNAAMDVARTAIRHGTRHLECFSLSKTISASEYEASYAKLEGVNFIFNKKPVEITDKGVVFIDLNEAEDGTLTELPGTEKLYPADSVIVSISQGPCTTITDSTKDLKTTPRGLFETDEVGRTSIPGIFASGDAVKGARTVVEAVAYSKNVAEAMHEYMQTLPPDLPDEYANVPVAEYGEGN